MADTLRPVVVVAVVWLCLGTISQAQIVAPSGRTLFNRAVMVRCTARLDAFSPEGHHLALPCAVNWGLYPHTNLVAVVPVATRRDLDDTASERGRETGLGDAQLIVQYDGFYRKNVPRGLTRLGGQFGIVTPSGTGGFGAPKPSYFATGIFSHVRDRHWFVSDLQFTWNRHDRRGSSIENRWNYDLAYLYRLLPLRGFRGRNLFLVFELNGQHVGRRTTPSVGETGGDLVFLSPGVVFLASNRLALEFSLPVPVVKDLGRDQARPRLSVIAGFRFLF